MAKTDSSKELRYLVGARSWKKGPSMEEVAKTISGIKGTTVINWGKVTVLFSSVPAVMQKVKRKINKTCVIGKEVVFRAI